MYRSSSMPMVMRCGASYKLQKGYPDESRDPANEGSLAHSWGAYKIKGGTENPQDPEMSRHVKTYSDYCRELVAQYPHALHGIEMKMNNGMVSGIPDFFIWTPYELIVIDFKYGYGWVDPYLNWQLLTYAILVCLKHGNFGAVIPPKVRQVIVQPRANHPSGPVREWSFEGELLRNYYNQIQNRLGEIQSGNETAVPGSHCRYCRALPDCTANREYLSHILDLAYAPEKISMSPQEIGKDLDILTDALKMITHRLSAMEALAEKNIKEGALVPGWMVAQGTRALSWDVPDPISAANDLDVCISKPVEPWTPTQVISKGLLPENMVRMMASRKPGNFTLKRQDLSFAQKLIQGGV